MDQPCWNEQTIAVLRFQAVQALFGVALSDRFRQCLAVAASFKADVKLTVIIRMDDDPGFGFAQIRRIELFALFVVRMDLYREFAGCIQKLEE